MFKGNNILAYVHQCPLKILDTFHHYSKHTVFGHVLYGEDIVKLVEGQEVDGKSRPVEGVKIANSGELVLQMKSKGMLSDKNIGCNCISGTQRIEKQKLTMLLVQLSNHRKIR